MSPKNNDDWRKLDRAKDKIKLPKKKDRKQTDWSSHPGDNPHLSDDSVDMDPNEWLDFEKETDDV